jgi:hypothetical protein
MRPYNLMPLESIAFIHTHLCPSAGNENDLVPESPEQFIPKNINKCLTILGDSTGPTGGESFLT